jgi:uncharacterized membrane protein YfcA
VQEYLALLIVLLSAMGTAATGFGFNLLSTPLLTFLYPPRDVVVLTLLLGLLASGALLLHADLRRAIDWTLMRPMCLASVVGMPGGLLLLQHADARALKALVAGLTTLFAALMLFRVRPRRSAGRLDVVTVGAVSGFLSTSTSLNGPPVVLYLIARGCPKDRFRANMVAFVFLATLASIVVMAAGGAVSPSTMALAWKLTPGVLLGFVTGSYLGGRLAPQAFDTVVLAYLALVGVLGMASVIL